MREGPIHVQVQRGSVIGLLNVHVHGSRNVAYPVGQFPGHIVIAQLVVAGNLYVDRRGHAEVENLRDDVGRLEGELGGRESPRQLHPQQLHIFRGWPVALLERDQDLGIRCADRPRIAIGEIDAAVGQADVIEHGIQFAGRDHGADGVFDLVGQARGLFDPQTGARAHVQTHQSSVHLRKQVLAQRENETQGCHTKHQECRREPAAVAHRSLERASVAVAHPVEGIFKTLVEAPKRAGRLVYIVIPQQKHHHGGHQRSRQQIRSQHGKDHGLRQRHEQEARDPTQEKHRNEYDADAERGNECGHGDLLRAVQNGLAQLLSEQPVALDVLDLHGGIVHQDSHRQRQPAERHQVHGFAQRAQTNHRNQNSQRDRNGDDQGAAPIAQEEQDHGGREAGRGERFANHALDGRAHEDGLIEERRYLELRRQSSGRRRQRRPHVVHNRERGCGAGLVDTQQRAAVAVLPHYIGLRRKTVAHVGHIADIDCRAVGRPHRQIVQLVDGLGAAVHFHLIFQRPEFGRAGRQNQVFRADRIHHIGRRQPLGLHGRRVDIDRNQPLFAAIRPRNRSALYGRQLGPDHVGAQVEQLLLAQPRAAQADL